MFRDMFVFVDRHEAGEQLAARLLAEPLLKEAAQDELLVLSIPRGGVVVGATVAQILGCAHDVVVVKKLGFPGQKEFAIGAMAEDGMIVLNREVMSWPWLEENYLAQEIERVKARIETSVQKFRQGRTLDLQSKIVMVVDDGIATGETMKATIIWMTSQDPARRPQKIVVAVPVCSPGAAKEFEQLADRLVCLVTPEPFWAISVFYWNFEQVSDEEVVSLLTPTQAVTPNIVAQPV